MIIKLVEVYEIKNHNARASYDLREIFINPEQITCLREDSLATSKLEAGLLPENLDRRQKFTRIHLNRGMSGIDVTVVGGPASIKEKLNIETRTLLKG
jgi:hypothetical protein